MSREEAMHHDFDSMTDEEIALLAQQGDADASEYLLNKYKNFVRSKARSYFLVGADHEDIVQEGMIGLFKARSASHIATISPALPFALFDRSIIGATEVQQYNGRIVFDGIIDCAKACLENGIPVGLGTDTGCPYITHYDMWREVYYFHKYCGVSNAFALHTATLGNAEILGMEDELGSIAPGKCADLIVTAANPLDDLKALRNVSMVVARGEIVDISGLKKYPAVEHELDKFLD